MKKPTVQIVRNHRRPKGSAIPNEDKRTLELRITYRRVPRYFATNGIRKLSEEEFNNKKLKAYKEAFEEVRPAYSAACEIVDKLGENFSFEAFARDYKRIVRKEISSVYDVRSIFDEYLSDINHPRPLSEKTKVTYNTTLNWLLKYKDDLTIDQITSETVSKLEIYIRSIRPDISQNSVNMYLRCLRAVYNFAVEKGYVDDTRPFKKQSLISTRKTNYGLSRESLKQILAYSSSDNTAQFGRDFFVLSFELNGHYMSDVLRLKNKNVRKTEDGLVLEFIRHKTMQHARTVSQFITDTAKEIIEKYGHLDITRPDEYIFPYLHNAKTEKQINDRIHDINHRANQGLRILSAELGLPHITIAMARHTYANLLCESGRSLMDIQMDMGHSNSLTTQGYINSLRTSAMKQSKAIKDQLHGEIEDD